MILKFRNGEFHIGLVRIGDVVADVDCLSTQTWKRATKFGHVTGFGENCLEEVVINYTLSNGAECIKAPSHLELFPNS